MGTDPQPPVPVVPDPREPYGRLFHEHALALSARERVRALAQSWAELPPEDDRRAELAADIDRHVGREILGMLDSSTAADVGLSRVVALAEQWMAPGGLALFYPAAGQAVLDAIRGGSTDEEASWRERAERAEARLVEVRQVAVNFRNYYAGVLHPNAEALYHAVLQVIDRDKISDEGEAGDA